MNLHIVFVYQDSLITATNNTDGIIHKFVMVFAGHFLPSTDLKSQGIKPNAQLL